MSRKIPPGVEDTCRVGERRRRDRVGSVSARPQPGSRRGKSRGVDDGVPG